MPSNSDLALVGATGVGYVGPTGTAAPVFFGSLNAAFHTLGYISDDGLTEGRNESRQEFTPWGSLNPIRTMIVKSEKSFKITCWETNKEVMSLYYRQALSALTPASGVITFEDNDHPAPDPRAFVFDVTDGTNLFRIYIPKGEVTEHGDVVYKTNELIGYPLTVTAYPGTDNISVIRHFKLDAIPT
jgi:hypothetical protein